MAMELVDMANMARDGISLVAIGDQQLPITQLLTWTGGKLHRREEKARVAKAKA